jgi:hypothetical protein
MFLAVYTKVKGKPAKATNLHFEHKEPLCLVFVFNFLNLIAHQLGWFANPIFSKEGDYPPIMKKRIAENSYQEGYRKSRLPKFSKEEVKYIRGKS